MSLFDNISLYYQATELLDVFKNISKSSFEKHSLDLMSPTWATWLCQILSPIMQHVLSGQLFFLIETFLQKAGQDSLSLFSINSTCKAPVLLLFIIKFPNTDSNGISLTFIFNLPFDTHRLITGSYSSARKIMSQNISDYFFSYSSIYSFLKISSGHSCGLF